MTNREAHPDYRDYPVGMTVTRRCWDEKTTVTKRGDDDWVSSKGFPMGDKFIFDDEPVEGRLGVIIVHDPRTAGQPFAFNPVGDGTTQPSAIVTLNEYQDRAMGTAVFPTHDKMPIVYPALGLAGEVVDKIKKVIRNGGDFFAGQTNLEIAKELGDVLWYIAALSKQLGFSLESIANLNLAKLADRAERGVLKSEGDNR